MTSPALRRRQKVLARKAAPKPTTATKPGKAGRSLRQASAPEGPESGPSGSEYATLMAVLHENLRSLSDIQSHEQRQPKKKEYARAFRNWIDGVLEADQPVQDEIVTTNMIWAIDYRDFDYALRLARFVIGHGLTLPERYNRSPVCFLAEEVAELALSQHEAVPHDVLMSVAFLVEGHDMPDPVTAKLLKAVGRSWKRKAEGFDPNADSGAAGGARAYAETAKVCFKRALELDESVGVKTDIRKTESLQRKLAEEAEAAGS